ncbi:MAG: hypothetical protein ACR2KX_01560 [Chitinophagaceae bacterium]
MRKNILVILTVLVPPALYAQKRAGKNRFHGPGYSNYPGRYYAYQNLEFNEFGLARSGKT